MDDRPEPSDPEPASGTIFTPHRRTQAVVSIASILSIALFWEGAKWLGIPPVPKVDGSLLAQPQWPQAILATYVMVLAAVVIGTIVAGRTWFFAGVFAAAVGLVSLSVRCGVMHYVLFDAASQGDVRVAFRRLCAEQCLLFVPIALVWNFFWRRFEAAMPKPEGDDQHAPGFLSTASAILTQIVVMSALVLLMAPTDSKKQVLVSVFVAGFAATTLGEYLFPNRKAARWYWLGPFIAGAVGYAAGYFNAGPWTTGSLSGPLANLAHPLPLDYAGAGTAGVLLGYWIGGDRPDLVFSLLGGLTTGTVVVKRRVWVRTEDPAADPQTPPKPKA